MNESVSRDLVALGHEVVAGMAQELVSGGRPTYLQLLASHFYEALRAELEHTPRENAAKLGTLAAAADQCRRSASCDLAPALMLVELRAAVAMLSEDPTRRGLVLAPSRPRFRVIEGGRA